jgi:tetratricopeptide (TPR) repeat protein
VPGTRTLVLTTFRSGYHAPWMEKSSYRRVALAPLREQAADELLRDLLGADPSLDGLVERIRERTDGNPFFIEEVVQALAEDGALTGGRGVYQLRREIDEIAIPPTVQAVLEARIDRLGDAEKAVLQRASVIGREFSETVLRRVVDGEEGLSGALAALVDAELIYEQSLYPELEYAFKHPLTQEVAYGSQLSERRARTHAAVARALTEVGGGDDGERAALLAHHWERAREPVRAARAHARAAEWAGVLHPQEAIRHWRKVRELLAGQPDTAETGELTLAACTQVLNLGGRVGLREEEIAATLDEGRALAERTGDLGAHAQLLASSALARGLAGDVQGALAEAHQAADLAARSGDRALELIRFYGALWRLLLGDLGAALADADGMIEVTRDDPRLGMEVWGFSPHAWAVLLRAVALSFMGRLPEAKAERERALALARELGDEETLGWARGASWYWWVTGETEGVLEQAHQGWQVAERLGSSFSQIYALATLARAHNLRAEWAQAAAASKRGLALAQTRRTGIAWEGQLRYILAEAQLGLGDVEAARLTAEDSITVSRRRGVRTWELMGELVLARALLAAGGATNVEAAAAALDRALALTGETGALSIEPFIRVQLAELARARGDEASRARELREAQRLFEAIGAPKRAARLAAAV